MAPCTRAVTWRLTPEASAAEVRRRLAALSLASDPAVGTLVGWGAPLVALLGAEVPGLRPFPALSGPGVSAPSAQGALWVRFSGTDPGALVHASRAVETALAGPFAPEGAIDGFRHAGGRDLTGYVDGTENPKGEAATAAALRPDGAAFVAVQPWIHDLARFGAHPPAERDRMIGRAQADDAELADAPAWSHVKRTAQESFDPPAFLVRRSTPFSDGLRHGLLFVAFARDLDAFEVQLRRMLGLDDGVTDALFRFSTPLGGAYYFVPPLAGDRLVLP